MTEKHSSQDPYEVGFRDAMAIAHHEVIVARAQLERCADAPSATDIGEILDSMAAVFAEPVIPQSGDFG